MKIRRTAIVNAASILLFAALSLCLLGFCYPNYLRKIESLNLFIGTSTYFDNCTSVPGGLLSWAGAYLTQWFYEPWIGSAIYTVLLALIYLLGQKAFNLPSVLKPVAALLPASVLIALTSYGYAIFALKPVGYAYMLPLGILAALLLLWLYRSITSWLVRIVLLLVTVVIGYKFFGCYGLLAALACALNNILQKGTPLYTRLIPLLICAIAVASYPYLWYRYNDSDLLRTQIYTSGLPRLYASETSLWLLYTGIGVIIVAAALISPVINKIKSHRYVALGIWTLSIIAMVTIRNNDPQLRLTLDLDRALWQQDWRAAMETAKKADGTPTRLNSILTTIALMRAGEWGNQAYSLPYGWTPYDTPRAARVIYDASGALISYHLGLINYANRWSTEYMIEQGMSVERLKMLTKCALLNYELPLAKRYLDLLYNMPNHREWARHYMRYYNNPLEMAGDKELAAIRPLTAQPNEFINDRGDLDGYVWPLLAHAPVSSPELNELSLQAAMISRDLESFIGKLPAYAESVRTIPRYYQEAALLWAKLKSTTPPIQIDQYITSRHDEFLKQFRATSSMGAERQRDVLRQNFGDTYWYYFIFTEDQR